jgi:hypothetical protein
MVKVAPSSSESSSSCLRRLLPLGFDKAGEANVVSGLVRKRAIGDMAILLPWEEFVASLEAGTAAISRGFRRFFSPVILFRLTYTEYQLQDGLENCYAQPTPTIIEVVEVEAWKRGNARDAKVNIPQSTQLFWRLRPQITIS